MVKAGLEALAARWRERARRKFHDADLEPDPMGRRLLEHGATVYFNCAQELAEACRESSEPAPPQYLLLPGLLLRRADLKRAGWKTDCDGQFSLYVCHGEDDTHRWYQGEEASQARAMLLSGLAIPEDGPHVPDTAASSPSD